MGAGHAGAMDEEKALKKLLIAALGMLALSAAAHPKGGKMTVANSLTVASKAGKVLVTVKVENHTAAPVYVPKAVYEDDELFRREFDIRDSSGAEVQYIGPMVKRGPYTRDDFLTVKPGGKVSNTIDITRSYDFKPGTHKYTVMYAGVPVLDLARLDAVAPPFKPAPAVALTYTGR